MNIKLIELYKNLVKEAIQTKTVFLDSGDYAGLHILLKEEDITPLQKLFTEHNAIDADWGRIIYLNDSFTSRMFLSNTYYDRKFRLSVYVSDFPTYGPITTAVDKFIKYLDSINYKKTTEDGKELSKGDKYYYVSKSWLGADELSVTEKTLEDDISKVANKIFADKNNAEEYIRINDKKYSWKDIEDAVKIMQSCNLNNKEFREQLKHYLEN